MEGRQAALREQIQHCNDAIDAIERALFEVQYEEEQLSYEWEIEREIDEKPRKAILSWAYDGEDDKRFRKSAAHRAAVHGAAQCGHFADHAAAADRQRPGNAGACRAPADGRAAETAAAADRDAEGESAREARGKAGRARQGCEGGAEGRAARAAGARREGRRASSRSASDWPRATTIKSSAASMQARIDNSDYGGGRAQRSMLTTSAPGSSGGINLASISRGVGGGPGSGAGMAGVKVTRASSAIAAVGVPGGDRPVSGDNAVAGRTDEEIQIVFDRYKSALYRLYNKELRRDPTLKGQVILKLTIEPDGSVSLCELKASDMNAPELTAQVVERVRGFDFGAKAVPAITILYPIDFLPAA